MNRAREVGTQDEVKTGEIHRLGMAGMGRNVGFGVNKVFVGPMLQALNVSQPMIGLILGMEGLFGLILNPLTGWLCDRASQSRFRHRMYVLIGLPGAAILWMIFYYVRTPLAAFIVIGLFYALQQMSISPYQAWMPELVSRKHWGLASGYLNLWWQIGNFVAFLVIPLVYETGAHEGSFVLVGIIMIGSGLVTGLTVHEPSVPPDEGHSIAAMNARSMMKPAPQKRAGWGDYARLLRGNLALFFTAQMFLWMAFESIASFFTLFIEHVAHGTVLDAALAMSLFTLCGAVSSFLTGHLYRLLSPKAILAVACFLFGLLALLGLFVHQLAFIFIIVGVEGLFWGSALTVAYALASDLLNQETKSDSPFGSILGGLYGLNNMTQAVGLLVAAPITGLVIKWSGGNYSGMFLSASVASFLAFAFVVAIRVRYRQLAEGVGVLQE